MGSSSDKDQSAGLTAGTAEISPSYSSSVKGATSGSTTSVVYPEVKQEESRDIAQDEDDEVEWIPNPPPLLPDIPPRYLPAAQALKDANGYKSWYIGMSGLLGSEVVEFANRNPRRPTTNAQNAAKWDQLDKFLASSIIGSSDCAWVFHNLPINGGTYWNALKGTFGISAANERIRAMTKLWEIKTPDAGKGMTNWVKSTTQTINDIRAQKFTIEQLISTFILVRLDDNFDSFRTSLDLNMAENNRQEYPKWEKIAYLLLMQSVKRKNSPSVYAVNGENGGNGGKKKQLPSLSCSAG